MSELTGVASTEKVKQPNRKEHKQINFRVSESEYLKLERSAKALNISVPSFVKKKAQGARIVAPNVDPEHSKLMARQLSALGNNVNQIARKLNSFDYVSEDSARSLSDELTALKKELRSIWQQLT